MLIPRAGMFLLGVLAAASPLAAEEGRADLDRAVEIRITADSLQELSDAIQLCREAILKGLSEENEKFARELLLSVQFQRALELTEQLYQSKSGNPRAFLWLQVAAGDIREVLAADPRNGHALLVAARLHRLAPGERERARELVEKALEQLPAEEPARAQALTLRGELTNSISDLDAALELAPRQLEAWLLRASLHLRSGEAEAALYDVEQCLLLDSDNFRALAGRAEILTALGRLEEALAACAEVIAADGESPEGYRRRAQVQLERREYDAALLDLNETLRRAPRDLLALLVRSRVQFNRGEAEAARLDIDRVLALQPEFPPALFVRSLIAASQRRFPEAINDARTLLTMEPENLPWRLHLATCLLADEQPRQALVELETLVEQSPADPQIHRLRADAHLRLGMHREAKTAYQSAIECDAEDSGTLNNLAWLLATSPEEEVRDGTRAVELAERAARKTDYRQAHILSTLAAAHAECGEFEKAREWIGKALDLADDRAREPLERELRSYQANQPFRERKSETTASRVPSSEDLELK